MTERDDMNTLTGAYALDALEPHEIASFEAYLADSEEARTEVAELTDTAVLLGMATRPITPPPALKSRIMAELMNTPQLASDDLSGISDADISRLATVTEIGAPTSPSNPATSDVEPSVEEHRRIRHLASGKSGSAKAQARWFTRPTSILVAAAAAAALFFAGTATGFGIGATPEDSQAASFTELFAASDLDQQTSAVAGGGEATLLWSDGLERAAVVISDLPALSEDQTYELWFIDGSGATPAGTFDAEASGNTVRVLEGDMGENVSVGITVEPAGGSKTPTTDPLVVIQGA